MTTKLHVRDKVEGKILERFSVDAHEIVRSDPTRFELVGRAPEVAPGGAGSTSAVLDNDTPKEVARKVLEATGAKPQAENGVSQEIPDEDVNGKELDDNGEPIAAKRAPAEAFVETDEKPDGKKLNEALVAAMDGLDPEEDFTGQGKPSTAALSEKLGYVVTGAERDAAWAAHEKAKAK